MRVTTQGEYGLRCMINIGKNGTTRPVSIQKISTDEGLPRTYVEQLLLKLRRYGLINSVRGAKGGYLLSKPASDITAREIILALEGTIFEIVCDRREKSRTKCKYNRNCALNALWHSIRERVDETLEAVSLGDLVKTELDRGLI